MKIYIEHNTPCATFRLHGARWEGGGVRRGWGLEHTALHPCRGKENVGRPWRNRGLVATVGEGVAPWTPP